MDFLAPQLYWEIAPPEQSYPDLLDWWIGEDVNTADRHVYAANAVYKIDEGEGNWPTSEIIEQVYFVYLGKGSARLFIRYFKYCR